MRLADYEVAAFASGTDFLASLPTRRPDCAIVDIHMPGLSGLEVQARLSAAQSGIPVVFITAGDEPGLEDTVRAAGGVTLLRKPFSSDALVDALKLALHCKFSHPS